MKIDNLIENLKEKHFKPFYFENKEDAIKKIKELIPNKSSIGFGGSVTINELRLMDILEKEGHTIYSHSKVKAEDMSKVYQLAQSANIYISSTNAITEHGDLINIDGTANRIATLSFGPKTIFYILGVNKIVKDVTEGIDRIRNYVAPKNCIRLNKNTPCAKSGKCTNCNSDDCICNVTQITHHPTRYQENVYIIIINEELGY